MVMNSLRLSYQLYLHIYGSQQVNGLCSQEHCSHVSMDILAGSLSWLVNLPIGLTR